MSDRLVGVVTRWFDQKGFGFIRTTGNGGDKDFFAHHSDLIVEKDTGRAALSEGDTVSFEVGSRRGKQQATKVAQPSGEPLQGKPGQVRDSRVMKKNSQRQRAEPYRTQSARVTQSEDEGLLKSLGRQVMQNVAAQLLQKTQVSSNLAVPFPANSSPAEVYILQNGVTVPKQLWASMTEAQRASMMTPAGNQTVPNSCEYDTAHNHEVPNQGDPSPEHNTNSVPLAFVTLPLPNLASCALTSYFFDQFKRELQLIPHMDIDISEQMTGFGEPCPTPISQDFLAPPQTITRKKTHFLGQKQPTWLAQICHF